MLLCPYAEGVKHQSRRSAVADPGCGRRADRTQGSQEKRLIRRKHTFCKSLSDSGFTDGFFRHGSGVSNGTQKRQPLVAFATRGLDAPLAHRRPGYSLSGCFPAEPDSVFPGRTNITRELRSVPIPIGHRSYASEIHSLIINRTWRALPPDEPEFCTDASIHITRR